MATRLGRFSFLIHAHAMLFPLRGSRVGKVAKVWAPKIVSPWLTPISPTSHGRCSANNSIACTNVSMLAGKTGLDGRQLREQQVASAPRPLSGTQAVEHLVGGGLHRDMTIALNGLFFFHQHLAPQVFEAVLDQIDPQGLKAPLWFLVGPECIWCLRPSFAF